MKGLFTSLVLSLLLLLLLLLWPKSGQSEIQIRRAIPARWKKHERLIVAIAKHETGNFTSKVFKRCNNAFGLKTFSLTSCPAPINESPGLYYKEFNSIEASVNDFIEWLEKRGINSSLSSEQVLVEMGKRSYYTDKNYIQKVKRWM